VQRTLEAQLTALERRPQSRDELAAERGRERLPRSGFVQRLWH
jgi:hypothetical protein